MERLILMGDEAVAQAALDAGIGGAFSYPGTPATEIFEYVHGHKPAGVWARWSTNEKVAYEEALGMSYAGRRALVSMKHVGLNVAADPFMNSAVTGVNGGLVLCVCDDPGMHSSQDEQDSRYYAQFAYIPALEPADQQEAYDMTRWAFRVSEQQRLPFLVRMVTRLAHSRAAVDCAETEPGTALPVVTDPRLFTLLPSNARRNWAALVDRWAAVEATLAGAPWNRIHLAGRRLGVVSSGVGFNYLMEVAGSDPDLSWVKVASYPVPRDLLRRLLDHCDEILVVEDGYPFLESALRGLLDDRAGRIHGKLDGTLPRTGELTPTLVRAALHLQPLPGATEVQAGVPGRPPALCVGCPHIETYKAINAALEGQARSRVMSDIGCYTLGALPPYNAIHSCVDMGASISMAVGVAAAGVWPVLAVIGESTFAHSGITPLIDAVNANANIVVVILDNSTVAMTGQQESAVSGDRLIQLLKGIGVHPDHVRIISPLPKQHEANVAVFREEIAYPGLSVIVPTRACIQIRK